MQQVKTDKSNKEMQAPQTIPGILQRQPLLIKRFAMPYLPLLTNSYQRIKAYSLIAF